jgi:glycosyltransferase involved in cell wall biosynthesis/SAM-dependent methyltransferase
MCCNSERNGDDMAKKMNLESRGNTAYTDGDAIEKAILDAVKGNVNRNSTKDELDWPLFYHLSPLRENILNWYPFKNHCRILEIGSGCGAITGLLCRRAEKVVSIELTEQRASIIFERHQQYDNLEILVGRFQDYHAEELFDYVIINGVLEYAGRFTSGNDPYPTFISEASVFLKEDGCMLLSIENRLGLKYFAGAKEDHYSTLFAGLNQYPDYAGIRTFSHKEIGGVINEAGMKIHRTFYLYPDYKMPEVIYTNEGYGLVPIRYNTNSYDMDRFMLFDELAMQQTLIDHQVARVFANSFLLEIIPFQTTKRVSESDQILFVKLSAQRKKEYCISTLLYKTDDGKYIAKKSALFNEGAAHIQQIADFYKNNRNGIGGVSLLPGQLKEHAYVYSYIHAPTFYTLFLQCDGDFLAQRDILKRYYTVLQTIETVGTDLYTKGFTSVFGVEQCKEKLLFINTGLLDCSIENLLCTENAQIIGFDYEWTFDFNLPVLFILWRSIQHVSIVLQAFSIQKEREELLAYFGITHDMEDTFRRWEHHFQFTYVSPDKKSSPYLYGTPKQVFRLKDTSILPKVQLEQIEKNNTLLHNAVESLSAYNDRILADSAALETEYSQLNTQKFTLEQHIQAMTLLQDALNSELQKFRAEAQSFAALYSEIINSQSWKLTGPLRKVLTAVKQSRFVKLPMAGIRYWRAYGFRASMQKIIVRHTIRRTLRRTHILSRPIHSFSALASTFSGRKDSVIYQAKILADYDESNKTKVLVLSHELNLTGGPMAILYLSEILKENDYLAVVASPRDGLLASNFEKDQIPTLVCPQLLESDMIRQFAGLFDIIIVNTIANAPAIRALYGFSQPILWWVHEAKVSYTQEILTALPAYLPDNIHVFTGGNYAKAQLQSYRPAWNIGELLYYVPDIQIETKSFTLPAQSEGKTIFASIGYLEERKGQDILVDALESLPEDELRKGYYVFVGRQFYPPIFKRITALCQRFPDAAQYIEELPAQDIKKLYQRMDCLVCCSKDDPMPVVVTEALAASKLVICSEHTGSATILRKDGSGLVYNHNDPAELAECILQVLHHGSDFDNIRAAARDSYVKHFSHEVFSRNLLKILSDITLSKSNKVDSLPSMVFAEQDQPASLTEDAFESDYPGTISVVIPTYNAGNDMVTLLKCLSAQTGIQTIEIVVVDSGSTDGTPDLCRGFGATVVEIPQSAFSHSFARNLGAKTAVGDILIFMTQDALPTDEKWVLHLIRPIVLGKAIAVSCKERCPAGTDLFYKIAIDYHTKYLGISSEDKLNRYDDNETVKTARPKASLSDVSTAINAKVFMQFLYRHDYAEDLDMGLRLLKSGYSIMLLSSVETIHGHNRPASYYLKRAFVEVFAFNVISPEMKISIQPETVIARKIAYATGLLSYAIEITRLGRNQPCTTAAFICELQNNLSTTLKERKMSDHLENYCDLLGWCINILKPLSYISCPTETELFSDVCYYLDTQVHPFLINQNILVMDVEIQHAVFDCLVKQFCLRVGQSLAAIDPNSSLFNTFQCLKEGV